MDKEQFQYYENSRYTNKRNKRRTLILDIKDSPTETSLGTGSEFNVKLFEPMNIDKQSEIYLDNVSTFNSNIAQTPDTCAFILKVNEFNMNSNVASTSDDTSKVKMFNSLIIPNEHKNISNNHTPVIQKGKKFNYVCDINPTTIYSLSGKITDLSGSPMFHGIDIKHKFTYRLSGIDADNLSTPIKPNKHFTAIKTITGSQTVDGKFLEHHKKHTTELHFSTNIELINTGDFESGTGDITFTSSGTIPVVSNTGSENPSLHLITNSGRFTAEFSIVSRE